MTRAQRFLIVTLLVVVGALPVIVYGIEHDGLGTPTFAETQAMSRGEQAAQVVAGLYVKPLYMLLSLALIIWLWGKTARGMAALFWGLSAFLVGEIFCAINFITYKHTSIFSEYIHSYGMAIAFGFIAYALLEIVDGRILHINHGRCAMHELCQTCKRVTPLHCAARRISMLTVTMTSMLAFLPLSASSAPKSYLTELFGFPYSYARFDLYQWYEMRALPLFALMFFTAAFIPLLNSKNDPIPRWTKILFSAGFGALGFSLFRLALASIFANDLVWFEFWEEFTELMFTSAAGFVLWQFREKGTTL
jgi:hypothetical protein